MNSKITAILHKVSNPPSYSSFHIRKGMISGRWFLAERSYPSFESPDWYDHEYLDDDEVIYLVENKLVPVWFTYKDQYENLKVVMLHS